MNYIFWGFFFVILDFNITSDTMVISLLPTFVGYILLYKGLKILAPLSFRFVKIQSWTLAMAAYMGLVYFMNLFGVRNEIGGLFFFLGLGSTLLGFYIQFNVAMGIKDIELNHAVFLNADTLILLWKIVAVGLLLVYVTLFIPPISLLVLIITVVANIIFLYYLAKARRAFEFSNLQQ